MNGHDVAFLKELLIAAPERGTLGKPDYGTEDAIMSQQQHQADGVRQAVGSSGRPADSGVARDLSELARQFQADRNPQDLLQHIAEAAARDVPGAAYAGITLLEAGELSTPAKSDELVAEIDRKQYELSEGPCVETSRKHQTYRTNDMNAESRWPKFAAVCVEAGVLAMLSVQLFVESEAFGALNLYATEVDAFDEDGESTALLLAAHAGIAMAALRNKGNMDVALASRDLIGQAKGILMERYKVTGHDAFGLLVLASQNTNRKLRDVANDLVTSGELAVR